MKPKRPTRTARLSAPEKEAVRCVAEIAVVSTKGVLLNAPKYGVEVTPPVRDALLTGAMYAAIYMLRHALKIDNPEHYAAVHHGHANRLARPAAKEIQAMLNEAKKAPEK